MQGECRLDIAEQQELIIRQKLPAWGNGCFSTKHTLKDRKRDVKEGTRRYSLPQPLGVLRLRDYLTPKRRSLWVKPQRGVQGEPDRTLKDWADPLSAAGDLDANSPRNSWRRSIRSLTSNDDGSTSSHHDSWSQSGHSNDRFSLGSNGSSSSALTRFSGSTLSTLLTAPSSGTSSWRSSRGSVLQRDKRFSNIKCESLADSLADSVLGSWLY